MKVCDLRWGWLDIFEINICWLMVGIGIDINLMIQGANDTCIVLLFDCPPTPPKYIIISFLEKYFYIHSSKLATTFAILLGV
jgi:hypothetical protein